ncbi:MAG TPA: peptidyl-prolyl cis-trans isomerase [Candidatus Angelobacter sp.]|nr:peptidyl-prolyl cis-trans isomerase [Candidatus Angelobacter sp.]
MIRPAMICIMAGMISAAQTPNQPKPATPQPSPATQTTPMPPAASPAVADSDTVITIQGLCPPATGAAPRAAAKKGSAATKKATGATASPDCTTTITKGQLEKLIATLNTSNQPVTPQVRRQFAQNYVELLAWNDAAKKAGVDDANFAELMRFVRMRTLVNAYRTRLDEQYRKPPDSEVDAYYKQNISKYEELKLSRLFIPAKNPSAQDKDAWEKKAAELANELHDRAAKGEDMEKLQKEAYTTLALTIMPPNSSLGSRRRGTLSQPQEQELFALKPGEVSKVEQEAAGYTIYKVEGRETMPVDKVKDEIARELSRQSMEAKVKAVNSGIRADLNDKYFGPPTPPVAPPSMVPPNVVRPSAVPSPAAPGAKPAPPQPAASPSAPKP